MSNQVSGGLSPDVINILVVDTSATKFQSSRDKIEQHLIKQHAQALGGPNGKSCYYRGQNATMCAAGCVIPDEKYSPDLEGETVLQIYERFPGVLPTDIAIEEMREWQRYHDTSARVGISFSYYRWAVEGDEAHHPSKFKEAIIKQFGEVGVSA